MLIVKGELTMEELILLIAFICIVPFGFFVIKKTDRLFSRDRRMVEKDGDVLSDELTFSHHWMGE